MLNHAGSCLLLPRSYFVMNYMGNATRQTIAWCIDFYNVPTGNHKVLEIFLFAVFKLQ